ncbi:hypothetical protein U1Q18_037587 [Sarracenia purpurea var. burkii]
MALASTGLLELYMMRKLLKEKIKDSMEEARDDDGETKEMNAHLQVVKDSTSSTGCFGGMFKKIHPTTMSSSQPPYHRHHHAAASAES